jgi:hypothetical protein
MKVAGLRNPDSSAVGLAHQDIAWPKELEQLADRAAMQRYFLLILNSAAGSAEQI